MTQRMSDREGFDKDLLLAALTLEQAKEAEARALQKVIKAKNKEEKDEKWVSISLILS